ncbi:MAG: hypothetical protein ABFS28_03480 [Bacteroidota bacterium]
MKLKRRGLIGTIIYHALLILLLVFAGLTYPDPPPEDEGILVNFGTDETGFGDFEPEGDDQQAGEPDEPIVQESEEIVEEIVEPVQEEQQAYTPPPDPQPVDQTQDVEEVQVKEDTQPTPEELERQRQEELERQRQKELERQRLEQERIERERREEEERIERERQEQAARLSNMGRDAFGNQGVGETEGSEGITEGSGNQGVPDGSPDADRYDTGGGLGNGISFGGLGSRRGSVPKPNLEGCEVTQKIEITVDIQVDRDGNVISAIVRSGTFQDKCIWDTVVAAAKLSRFSVDRNANYRQTGWIKYIIVP